MNSPFEELKNIFKNTLQQKGKETEIKFYETDPNFRGEIKKYTSEINLYNIIYYTNTTENSNLIEELTLNDIQGQTIIYPYIGRMKQTEEFKIDLRAQRDYMIIYKFVYENGYKINWISTILSSISIDYKWDYLENLLKTEGEKENGFNGILEKFQLKKFDWYCFLYQNIYEKRITLTIEILTFKNLECVTHVIPNNFCLHKTFSPNEKFFIAFRKKDPSLGWSYRESTSLQYY